MLEKKVICLYQFLGYPDNKLMISNNCYGCKPDYKPNHHPINTECPNYKPITIYIP